VHEIPRPRVVRKLSDYEKALVRLLIEKQLGKDSEYLLQVENASVVRQCECGCGTVDLSIRGKHPGPPSGSAVLVDGLGVSANGDQVAVMLFAREGLLCSLEVYSLAGNPGKALPILDSVSVF